MSEAESMPLPNVGCAVRKSPKTAAPKPRDPEWTSTVTCPSARPKVWDQTSARDSVQYTNSLPPGTSKRIEYPVDGKKVSVTRVVRDRAGNVIHKDTYFSHYKTVTGVVLIGRGAAPSEGAN